MLKNVVGCVIKVNEKYPNSPRDEELKVWSTLTNEERADSQSRRTSRGGNGKGGNGLSFKNRYKTFAKIERVLSNKNHSDMEDDNFEKAVKEAVLEYLPLLSEVDLERLVEFLISLGITEVAELRLVKEDDLVPGLTTMEARKLLEGWSTKYGNLQSDVPQPQSSRSRDRGAHSRSRQTGHQDLDEPKDWDFTLDWQDIYNISPSIKRTLERGKNIKKAYRKQIIERIVTQVRNKVPHCERKTFVQVMKDMKQKYKTSFRHELAKGIIGKQSLVAAMQAKFDNDKRPLKRRSQMEVEAPSNCKAAYGCVRWRVTTLPDGETPQSLEAIRVELVEIHNTIRPSAWNFDQIKEKMNQTYALQRKDINAQAENLLKLQKESNKRKRASKTNKNKENTVPETETVNEPVFTTIMLQEKWPFLFKPDGMMNHFEELTKVKFEEQLDTFLQGEAQRVMEFFTVKEKGMKKIKKRLDKSLERATRMGSDMNSPTVTAFLKMLSKYLKEDFTFLIRVIQEGTLEEEIGNETEIPTTPLIIVAGESIYKPKNIFFTMDGFVHGTAKNMFEAVGLLFTSYFVFNLTYAPQVQVSLEFIQRCVALMNPPRGNKRPTAEESRSSKGQQSMKQIHPVLAKLTNQYEAFIADQEDSEESDPDDLSPTPSEN